MIYLDDSFLLGKRYLKCVQDIEDTIYLFRRLVLQCRLKNSVLTATQKLEFLGYTIDNEEDIVIMTTTSPPKKKEKIKTFRNSILSKKLYHHREVAHVLGKMAATFEAVTFAKLKLKKKTRTTKKA